MSFRYGKMEGVELVTYRVRLAQGPPLLLRVDGSFATPMSLLDFLRRSNHVQSAVTDEGREFSYDPRQVVSVEEP